MAPPVASWCSLQLQRAASISSVVLIQLAPGRIAALQQVGNMMMMTAASYWCNAVTYLC